MRRKYKWNIVFIIGVRSKDARLWPVRSFKQNSQSADSRAWWNFIPHQPCFGKQNFPPPVFSFIVLRRTNRLHYIFSFSSPSFSLTLQNPWRKVGDIRYGDEHGRMIESRWQLIEFCYARYVITNCVKDNARITSN